MKSTQVHGENSEDAGKYTAIAEKTYMPAERINTRLKNFKSQSFSRKAHEQAVCGEAETSEGFLGAFFKKGVFLFKRWIRISKRRWKGFENLSQDVTILVASFSESCSRIADSWYRNILFDFIAVR